MIARRAILLSIALVTACTTAPRAPMSGGAPTYKIGEPYRIKGKTYKPKEEPDYFAVGVASWYGDQFHGRRTANGEIFDKNRLSAAHTTLPLPSIVEIENLENGRRIAVRVNDRGPFVGDRLIDVSHAAARGLGFERQGLARVRVRYLGRADLMALAPLYGSGEAQRLAAQPPPPSGRPALAATAVAASPIGPVTTTAVTASPMAPITSSGDSMAGVIETALAAPRPAPAEYWIDVATFADLDALESARLNLAGTGEMRMISLPAGGAAPLYGLQVGPFADSAAAFASLAALREAGYPDASIAGSALCFADAPADVEALSC